MNEHSLFELLLEDRMPSPSALDPLLDRAALVYIACTGGTLRGRLAIRRITCDTDLQEMYNEQRIGTFAAERLRALGETPQEDRFNEQGDALYWCLARAARRETDAETLRRAVLSEKDFDTPMVKRFALCRYCGHRVYEPCDAISHRSYHCGQAEGISGEQVAALCRDVIKTPPDGDAWLPKEAEKVLSNLAKSR